MPLRRRSATVALVPLIPLAFLATACGGIGNGWAGHAKTAADSPVGNTGAPNTGISAEALAERAAGANRDARSVRGEFSGTVYGEPLSGDTVITKTGDSESHLDLKGHGVHLLVVGGHTYTRLDPGTYATLFEILRKAPGYDADSDEPGDEMSEFFELVEGKYLQADKDAGDNGFLVFDGILDDGPFEDAGIGSGGSDDSDDSYGPDDDDYDFGYSYDTTLALGERTRVNGIDVIPLIATTKDDDVTSIATMYLPAHGTPLPVRLTSDDDNDGDIDASVDTRYFTLDGDKTVTAPKDEDSVDMEKAFDGLFGRDETWDDSSDSPYDEGGSATA